MDAFNVEKKRERGRGRGRKEKKIIETEDPRANHSSFVSITKC